MKSIPDTAYTVKNLTLDKSQAIAGITTVIQLKEQGNKMTPYNLLPYQQVMVLLNGYYEVTIFSR